MAALLADRVAVVTGGGGGIGRGVATKFAAEGARVVVAEIDETRAHETVAAIAGDGGIAIAAVLDVTTSDGATRAVDAAVDEYGHIDVLVNNVGHFGGARRAFHENTDEEWDDLYRVNLAHVLGASRAAITKMLEQGGGGSIVNVSTIEAFRAIPTRAVYSAFKAAITGFTRSVAVEYARDGIRVNAIAPDVVETLQVPYSRWVKPEQEHMVPTWVPLGRFGQPADVADVALFLASDLSRFVTGTTVPVDGGTFAAGGWFPTEEGGWTNRPRRP
ncbi:MAG TPA: glucose 1-dehydrogenase [Acidimicrobiia bacterium]|nr:glucose 1-dehydrogenase [Acidimicrobiia bacterium]